MCEPATLALIATGVAAAGSALGTVSAMQAQTYQARIADRNAALENASARDALDRGRTETQAFQRKVAQQQGAQRAALAANGIDASFGSAADIRGDTAMFGQEDAATLRENAMREVRGFEINASNYRAQATGERQARTATMIQGVADFGSTILGGAQQHRRIEWNRKRGGNPWG